jgi:pimeloyl-ACP methyl ester carboxylesterase
LLVNKGFFRGKDDKAKSNKLKLKERQDFPMKIIILILLGVVIVFVLIRGQQRMIYYPHPYGEDQSLPDQGQVVEYGTSQGRQVAFYLPPAGAKKVPARLWLMCGGNASLALDWLDLLEDFPDPATGFLLLDYPGYGDSQGRPGPETIMESAEAALAALAIHLKTDRADLDSRLMVMGHSLGAAAVLRYADRWFRQLRSFMAIMTRWCRLIWAGSWRRCRVRLIIRR